MLRIRARGPLAVLAACSVAAVALAADKGPPVPPAPRVPPLSPEVRVQAIRAEQEAYTRRLDICTQLRRIAVEKNDPKLEAEALQLEQMAEQTMKLRLAKLGVKSDPRSSTAQLESLDRALGSGAAVTPLTATKPGTAAGPATAKSGNFKVVDP